MASCGLPCEIQDSATHIQGLTFESSFLHQRHVTLTKPVRVLRSQCAPTLEKPRTRSVKYGDMAFSTAAPALWNGLAAHIRCAKTLEKATQNVVLQTRL